MKEVEIKRNSNIRLAAIIYGGIYCALGIFWSISEKIFHGFERNNFEIFLGIGIIFTLIFVMIIFSMMFVFMIIEMKSYKHESNLWKQEHTHRLIKLEAKIK